MWRYGTCVMILRENPNFFIITNWLGSISQLSLSNSDLLIFPFKFLVFNKLLSISLSSEDAFGNGTDNTGTPNMLFKQQWRLRVLSYIFEKRQLYLRAEPPNTFFQDSWVLLRVDQCAFTIPLITDIDECSLGVDICGTNNTCTNSEGGYYCTCGPGYVPAVDRRSCIGRLNL